MNGDAKKLARTLAGLVAWHEHCPADQYAERVESARKLLKKLDPAALTAAIEVMTEVTGKAARR